MSKKKKKKQAAVDNSQLIKGGVIFALIAGVVYFLSSLDGGGAASGPAVVNLAPVQNHNPNPNVVAPPAGNGQQQPADNQPAANVKPFAKPGVTPTNEGTPGTVMVPPEGEPEPKDMTPFQKKPMTPTTEPSPEMEIPPFATEGGDPAMEGFVVNNPARIKELEEKLATAKDITGTEQGNKLLVKVRDVRLEFLYTEQFDTGGRMKEFVKVHAEQSLLKADIELLTEKPEEDEPVLIITLNASKVRKSSQKAIRVSVEATLIGVDSDGASENKFVKLWVARETDIGVVSSQALSQGVVPRRIGEKLTSYFNKLHSAQSRAKRSL